MARIRTIKPEFWQDEKIGQLSIPARLLYIGLWNLADNNGVIRGNAVYIKAQIFPYDGGMKTEDVNEWLCSLVKAKMLIPFSHDRESFYLIRTFRKHQKTDVRWQNELIPTELVSKLTGETIEPQRGHNEDTTRPHRRKGKGKGKGN